MSPIVGGGSGGGGMANPMTTAGDLIYGGAAGAATRLAAGSAGQLLQTGATPAWVLPPGYEWSYTQITAAVNVVSTTEASGTTIISPGAFTPDGAAVLVTFYAPYLTNNSTATGFTVVSLFEGATQIARLLTWGANAGSLADNVPVFTQYRFTPTNAAHTYTITAFSSSTTGTPAVGAGAGGTGAYAPAFIRFTKV